MNSCHHVANKHETRFVIEWNSYSFGVAGLQNLPPHAEWRAWYCHRTLLRHCELSQRKEPCAVDDPKKRRT